MKTLVMLAGLSLIVASPALAADPNPDPSPTPKPQVQVAARAKPTRYCVVDQNPTASLIPRRLCRTRAEWEALGFELPAR